MANFKIFRYPLIIKEHHLDTFSHVNNAVYLQMFEEARWELLTANGIDLQSIHRTATGPVILEFTVKFLKELKLRQSIVIESQMLGFDKKIGIMRQDIYNAKNELCTEATMTFAIFNMKTRKLIEPPDKWLSVLTNK